MKRFNPESIDDDSVSFSPQSTFLRRVSSMNQYQTQTLNLNVNQNQNPSVDHRRFLPQFQNPYNDNQTLEDAFSRLSLGNPSNGYGASSFQDSPYYNHGFQATNCCQNHETAVGFNGAGYGRGRPLIMSEMDRVKYNQIEFLWRQNGYGYGYDNSNGYGYGNGNGNGNVNNLLNVSVSAAGNGNGGGNELGRRFQYGLLNESSAPWLNVNGIVNDNGRRSHWFDRIRGMVYLMAKDQNGSMILGELMENFGREAVSYIFTEVIDHVSELMIDPFGNIVIQKMVGLCNENQLTRIVLMVTSYECQLVRISVDLHGYIFNHLSLIACFLRHCNFSFGID